MGAYSRMVATRPGPNLGNVGPLGGGRGAVATLQMRGAPVVREKKKIVKARGPSEKRGPGQLPRLPCPKFGPVRGNNYNKQTHNYLREINSSTNHGTGPTGAQQCSVNDSSYHQSYLWKVRRTFLETRLPQEHWLAHRTIYERQTMYLTCYDFRVLDWSANLELT